MSANSQIQWCDHTWPLTSGCDKVSAGCKFCYAIFHSWRLAHNPNPKIAAAYEGVVAKVGGDLKWTGKVNELRDRLDWPRKWRKPARIFVANMGDLFHDKVSVSFLNDAFDVMDDCPHHQFLILTKRPENMVRYLKLRYTETGIPYWIYAGVSIENQKTADERLPILGSISNLKYLKSPIQNIRFVSYEPALESVDFSKHWDSFNWLIMGGESGTHARPFCVNWAQSPMRECADRAIGFFMKQLGSKPYFSGRGGSTSGHLALKDKHGGTMSEWPEELRTRQFPTSAF